MVGEEAERKAREAHTTQCEDVNCRAHGPFLRRIKVLEVALDRERRANRVRLAGAWNAFLELALQDTLEDGTPVLAYVLLTNPDLRLRLSDAMNPRTTPTTKETTDELPDQAR
jgi:hypothetical protein